MSGPADLKSRIGLRSPEKRQVLDEKLMRDFGACIHATRGNTVHSPITSVAVPTILTRFRDGEFELLTLLGIELKNVLHAEQEYRIEGEFRPGEEIAYETTFASVVEKKGKDAKLAFVVFETPFVRASDSSPLAYSRTTFVHRTLIRADS
jgi:hypothetical protein